MEDDEKMKEDRIGLWLIVILSLIVFLIVIDYDLKIYKISIDTILEKDNLTLECDEYEQIDVIKINWTCGEFVLLYGDCGDRKKYIAQENGDCIEYKIMRKN